MQGKNLSTTHKPILLQESKKKKKKDLPKRTEKMNQKPVMPFYNRNTMTQQHYQGGLNMQMQHDCEPKKCKEFGLITGCQEQWANFRKQGIMGELCERHCRLACEEEEKRLGGGGNTHRNIGRLQRVWVQRLGCSSQREVTHRRLLGWRQGVEGVDRVVLSCVLFEVVSFKKIQITVFNFSSPSKIMHYVGSML